jgi:hypothetical protein
VGAEMLIAKSSKNEKNYKEGGETLILYEKRRFVIDFG